jgi:hypothetical protein
MKHIFIILFAAATLPAYGQTAKQINVPGTRLLITPPDNFQPATSFAGLQSDNAVIQVFDLNGGNFYKNAATFSKEKFEKKGITVFDYKDTTIGGYSAKYIYMQAKPEAKSYNLVFGDTTFSVMLMANFPADDSELNNELKKAVLSAKYDKTIKVNPLEHAAFTLDDTKSAFKFATGNANLYAYSIGGKDDGGGDEPVVLAMPLPTTASMTPESLAGSMVAGFAKKGIVVKETRNKWKGTVNGYAAYEAELYCESGDKKNLTYEFAVINGDKAVVFLCMAHKDYVPTLKEFKSLVKTVKFK